MKGDELRVRRTMLQERREEECESRAVKGSM
jgi:hypothetical protein